MGRKSGEQVGLSFCHGLGGNQVFAYTKRQQVMSDDNCLDSASKDGPVKLVRCHGMGGNQAWNYNEVVSIVGGSVAKNILFRDSARSITPCPFSNDVLFDCRTRASAT